MEVNEELGVVCGGQQLEEEPAVNSVQNPNTLHRLQPANRKLNVADFIRNENPLRFQFSKEIKRMKYERLLEPGKK